jgi:hypothetical protein
MMNTVSAFTHRGDYAGAAAVLAAAIRLRKSHHDDPVLFNLHNWMAIIREAQGDIAGALLECAERTASGYEGTWEPASERLKLTRLKDDWHRAYLGRMLAEQLTGAKREAVLLYAEQARRDYVDAGGYADAIAVLDAFFAMHDHQWERAREAVRRINVDKDDDLEDLYIAFSALDAAGDRAEAAAVRKRMEQLAAHDTSFGSPIWLTWIRNDSKGAPHFSPRFPNRRP